MELCNFTLWDYLYKEPACRDIPGWNSTMEDGTASDRVALISEIMKHILNGLVFIHDLNEIHRDLHPSNGNPNSYFELLKVL